MGMRLCVFQRKISDPGSSQGVQHRSDKYGEGVEKFVG
jgi:hypothetical protein